MKKKKRTSIKDIAEKLKVSVTTVSFVLNGKAKERRISEEVTQKILDYVEKINYKPNQLAQSLRTGNSNLLVFMVEDISNPFFAKLARIVEDKAYQKGYKVLFCSNDNDDKKSRELIELFVERQVDGFIINPSAGIEKDIVSLINQNIPVVIFDRYFPGLDVSYVGIDNESASISGVDHLAENGYKSIGFITIGTTQTQMQGRLEGYKKGIKKYGMPEKFLEIPFYSSYEAKGKSLIKDFLIDNPHIDSLLFATNYLTRIGLEVIKENDLQGRFGLLTFDDNELFKISTPAISAICQPMEEMSATVMDLLLKRINYSEPVPYTTSHIELDTTLEVRESTLFKKASF